MVDKYLGRSNLINHVAVKTMGHVVLFTNKPVLIADWLTNMVMQITGLIYFDVIVWKTSKV